MERFEKYSRITGDTRYRWIAKSNIDRFDSLNQKVFDLRKRVSEVLSECDDPDVPPSEYYELREKLNPIEEERDQAHLVAVVFTAMYFEAFIYDYAASSLGDSYVKNHLDKLDFISKWLVIPKLVMGKGLSKRNQGYEVLRQLHKDRNSLVHLKSKKFEFDHEEISKYLEKREIGIIESVNNCRKALKVVVAELNQIDPGHPKVKLSMTNT